MSHVNKPSIHYLAGNFDVHLCDRLLQVMEISVSVGPTITQPSTSSKLAPHLCVRVKSVAAEHLKAGDVSDQWQHVAMR